MAEKKDKKWIRYIVITLFILLLIVVWGNRNKPDSPVNMKCGSLDISVFKFNQYDGKRVGAQIKQLIETVNLHNQDANEESIVTINNYNALEYKFEGHATQKYNVYIDIEYGLVTNINIYEEENISDSVVPIYNSNNIDWEKRKETIKNEKIKETEINNDKNRNELKEVLINFAGAAIVYLLLGIIIVYAEKKSNKVLIVFSIIYCILIFGIQIMSIQYLTDL